MNAQHAKLKNVDYSSRRLHQVPLLCAKKGNLHKIMGNKQENGKTSPLILISAVTFGWYSEKIKAWIPPDLYQWFLSRSINCALNATVFLSNVVDHAHPFMITASNGSSSRMAWTTSLRSVSYILNHKEFRQLRSQ